MKKRYKMQVPGWIRNAFVDLADWWVDNRRQPVPARSKLAEVQLVAHRGIFDNRRVFENTMAAFRPVVEAGTWGLELDVRWTRDLEPVVIHDPDGARLFNRPVRIAEVSAEDLRRQLPEIPTLREVAETYGGRLHLMMELKEEPCPDKERQGRRLLEVLDGLQPEKDYHLMSLNPGMFECAKGFPPECFLPIAEANIREYSRQALQEGWGGVTGHFLLVTNRRLQSHHEAGQQVGTGFPASRNALFREINRGVDWIFTDRTLEMQAILDEEGEKER